MRGLANLTRIEARLLFPRDPVVLLVALAVPIGILLVFGLPGFARDPAPELGGQRPIDTILPSIALAVSVGVLAISALPATWPPTARRASCAGWPPPRPAEVEVTLLRTAQEALANVAKHAGASRAGLTLSYLADLVTLDIRDDGVGFNPVGARGDGDGGGFGLTVMRQRVGRLAGTLEIESEPGAGTAVFAGVPAIPREAPDA